MAKVAVTPDQAKVAQLVDSVWEHRDELQRLARELPVLLAEAGSQMRAAGEVAQRASGALSGDVRTFAGHAADVLEESKHQLKAVLQALEGAGKMLRNLPFIGDMGKTMGESLGAIGDVADNLDVVGRKVRGLGDRLADVGADLDVMGASLLGTGLTLTRSSGAAPTRGAAREKKAPPKKRASSAPVTTTATKKAADKKAPAKRDAAKSAAGKNAAAKKSAPKNDAAKKAAVPTSAPKTAAAKKPSTAKAPAQRR